MRKILILCLSLAASGAEARSLYINGSRVDGLTNVKLNDCDVTIDAAGDIWITAKGYRVETVTPTAAPPATPPQATPRALPPTGPRRYYVAAATHGDAQFDIDLYINGQLVKRFASGATPPPVEITRWLHAGDNALRFRAVKREGPRTSVSPDDYLELILGEGTQKNGQLELEKFHSYRRTAAEAGLFTDDAKVTIR
jgi:hypothetical protein